MTYYRTGDVFLTRSATRPFAWHSEIYGELFTFKQDNAPAHPACKTISLLK